MTPAQSPSQTLETPKIPRGPSRPQSGGGDGAAPDGDGRAAHPPLHPARMGVLLLVGAITVLFAAFTSTYLARRAEADWHVGPLPSVLWVNTAVLLLSSVILQWARQRGRLGHLAEMRRGLAVATGLGILFIGGQIAAWRQLVGAGIYLTSNPHSAFFYLLTGMHAVHLLGGVGALVYTVLAVRRTTNPSRALDFVEPTTTYWHFVDGLWLYIFGILFWF